MNENNVSISIETNSIELSQNEHLTLLITIKNTLNETIHNVLLRNFIDPDCIKIDTNEFGITNNNFINLGTLMPNEIKTITLNLSAIINYKKSCIIHSLITYSAFENGKSSSINIKSNKLDILLNPNCSNESYDNNLSFIDYNFTRSSEMILEKTPLSSYDSFDTFNNITNNSNSSLEPKLVGYNNSCDITKSVDNKRPQVDDIITFELFIKNVGNIDLKTIMYEEDFDSNLEFIKDSLYINNMPYDGDVYYGVKINNFKINDELTISYKVKVLNNSSHNLLSKPGLLTYSYISDRNITHKSVKVKCPIIKTLSQNTIINSNKPESSRGKEIFRNELSITTYSLKIIETSDLQTITPKKNYNYQFKIQNDGNMKCNSMSLNIELPSIFLYKKNSLCLNKNSLQIENLDYEINLPELDPNELITIDFNFEPEISLNENNGSISVYLTSSFKTYTNEIIQKNFSKEFKPISVENNIIKELNIDSEYHIKNPEPSINKILNVESDAKISNCSEVTPVRNRFNSNSMRYSNKRFSVKGVIKNKIQYISNDNSVQTIERQTPFSTILSSQDNFQGDISSLIVKCNNVSFKVINRKLISVTNFISIH